MTNSHLQEEIRRQPEAWARAVELARKEAAGPLPQPGERVAVIGCGTSWHVAIAYAALREAAGQGETDAFAASSFPSRRRYDRVVAISRSGTTTEVVEALAATAAPSCAITALRDGPVSGAAASSVLLDFADEKSVVQTVFATTALMLLRASLGEALAGVIEQATSALTGSLPAAVEDARQMTFLGQGWAYGLALEAGLKAREAAQLWTEAYPQMEYRHGPIAIAETGRVVWVLGRAVPGIAGDVAATGATLVDDDLDPVADLVRVQLLAVRRAVAQGLDPDNPRHLARSVILAGR